MNGVIGWMVINLISKEANVVLKIYKTLRRPHTEYCTQARASVLRHGHWSVILRLEDIKKSDKTNKKSKTLQLQKESEKN